MWMTGGGAHQVPPGKYLIPRKFCREHCVVCLRDRGTLNPDTINSLVGDLEVLEGKTSLCWVSIQSPVTLL